MNKRYFLSIIVTIIAIMAHTLSMMARPYCDVRKFSIVDGLAANTISDMKQAPDGLMWFSTWNGLSYYDGYSFYTFRDVPGGEDVLSTNRIIDIYPTTRNNVWCVSSDRKIYLYSTHSCKFLNSEKSINEQFGINLKVDKLYPIKKGSTWITTQNGNYIIRTIAAGGSRSRTHQGGRTRSAKRKSMVCMGRQERSRVDSHRKGNHYLQAPLQHTHPL